MSKLYKICIFSLVFLATFCDVTAQEKSKDEFDHLKQLDISAQVEYKHMTSHPKVVPKDFVSENKNLNLSDLQYFEIEYDAKKIEFNSLFVKTILENESIEYVNFSPTRAMIWAKKSLNKQDFISDLNRISMTEIFERNNK